jgi:hypothetical protein
MQIIAPAGCRILEVSIDGEPASIAPEQSGLRVRLPAGDRAFSFEMIYDAAIERLPGAVGALSLETPHIVGETAVEEVLWLIRTSQDRLLIRQGGESAGDVVWKFRGVLSAPTAGASASNADEWLSAGDATLRWSTAAVGSPDVGGKLWVFQDRENGDRLSIWSIREPLWILFWSGLSLMIGMALAAAGPKIRQLLAIPTGLTVLGLWALAPQWGLWIWFGAQWGVYLAVATIAMGRWIARRRRSLFDPTRFASGSKRLSISSSSLLRRPPTAGVHNPIGSTIDAG